MFKVQIMPQRYILIIMTLLAMVSVQSMNSLLSLTMTQMVEPKILKTSANHNESLEQSCPIQKIEEHSHGNGSTSVMMVNMFSLAKCVLFN